MWCMKRYCGNNSGMLPLAGVAWSRGLVFFAVMVFTRRHNALQRWLELESISHRRMESSCYVGHCRDSPVLDNVCAIITREVEPTFRTSCKTILCKLKSLFLQVRCIDPITLLRLYLWLVNLLYAVANYLSVVVLVHIASLESTSMFKAQQQKHLP